MAEEEANYKIKYIAWPPGSTSPRRVPILLQDMNGPCPLIAIINVLLLRGSVSLPSGVGEISQARAVQVVAEHLLDANFPRTASNDGVCAGTGGATNSTVNSDDFQASLRHNLSDAITILPKLTTGIDVNVRFNHTRSLEYTAEMAVFDLLNIDLVHGWLCDPQDASTAAAIGTKSYNELVMQLVSVLGEDAKPSALSPALSRRSTLGSYPSFGHHQQPADQQQEHPPALATHSPPQKIDAASLSAALESTLRITIPDDGPPIGDLRSISTSGSAFSQSSVTSAINHMMADTVNDAFKTCSPTPASDAVDRPRPLEPEQQVEQGQAASDSAAPSPGAVEPAATTIAAARPRDEGAVHDVLMCQQFIESNPSQLTVYGLASLLDGLTDGQLAVFFRNNHFNVMMKSGGGLYILITDQGYLFEPDVVWEHLSNVDGDTQLLTWDLKPFSPHTSRQAIGVDGISGLEHNNKNGDALGMEGMIASAAGNADADFALAMQLQQEEEERARVADERRRASAASAAQGRAQQQQQPSGGGGGGSGGGASQQQHQRPPMQQQAQQQGEGSKPGGKRRKDKSSDCSIM